MDGERRRALFEAILRDLAEHGYMETSAARARETAGVSEEEFAAEFSGKDECLFEAYEHLGDELVRRARAAQCAESTAWPQRMQAGLEVILAEIAAQPDIAKVATRSFPAIRPAAYRRYVDLLARFVPFVEEGRSYSGIEDELPEDVGLLAVGAAEAIIFAEVDAGRAERLPTMMPEILFSLLVPFIGPDRAADEMRSAAGAA